MKLRDLREDKADEAKSWFDERFDRRSPFGGDFDKRLMIESSDGFSYNGKLILKIKSDDRMIKYPLNKISDEFILRGLCRTLKNGPKIVEGGIDVAGTGLESLKFSPREVHGLTIVFEDSNLTSLEHFPKLMAKTAPFVSVNRNKLTNLKGINKYIPRCQVLNIHGNPIKSNLLSLLLIEDLDLVHYYDPNKCKDAIQIINEYLAAGKRGRSAVISAQQELIENDLDEFAEL